MSFGLCKSAFACVVRIPAFFVWVCPDDVRVGSLSAEPVHPEAPSRSSTRPEPMRRRKGVIVVQSTLSAKSLTQSCSYKTLPTFGHIGSGSEPPSPQSTWSLDAGANGTKENWLLSSPTGCCFGESYGVMAARAASGVLVMRASTPKAVSVRSSSGLSTVHTLTARLRAWAAWMSSALAA
jgi:hypothetical protein